MLRVDIEEARATLARIEDTTWGLELTEIRHCVIQGREMATLLEALGVLLFVLLVADFILGNSWANTARYSFKRLSEVFLAGALLEPYHQNLRGVLDFVDRRIGRFIPTLVIIATVFTSFGIVFLSGGLVQAVQEHKPLAPYFFRDMFVFCLGATASLSLCYTVTYLVLHLINTGLRPFVPKYIYLVSLEVLFSYFLAPLGFALLFLFDDCPANVCGELYEPTIRDRIRSFGMVVSSWPSSVAAASYEYVHDFQSAVNLVLLYLSMALCVLPTAAHIGMFGLDILRYILKRVCEGLMDVFDRLAAGPAPMRRFLLGALSILSALGWLLG